MPTFSCDFSVIWTISSNLWSPSTLMCSRSRLARLITPNEKTLLARLNRSAPVSAPNVHGAGGGPGRGPPAAGTHAEPEKGRSQSLPRHHRRSRPSRRAHAVARPRHPRQARRARADAFADARVAASPPPTGRRGEHAVARASRRAAEEFRAKKSVTRKNEVRLARLVCRTTCRAPNVQGSA